MRYTVAVPFTDDMGSVSPVVASSTPMESREANALWTLNSMRDHDGLPRLRRLPNGTTFRPLTPSEN